MRGLHLKSGNFDFNTAVKNIFLCYLKIFKSLDETLSLNTFIKTSVKSKHKSFGKSLNLIVFIFKIFTYI